MYLSKKKPQMKKKKRAAFADELQKEESHQSKKPTLKTPCTNLTFFSAIAFCAITSQT